MDTKVCRKCHFEKDVKCFSKHKEHRDGLQHFCKTCDSEKSKKHYRENKGAYRHRIKQRVESIYSIYFEYIKTKSCVDCGESNPLVLDHDHVTGSKKFGISQMITGGYSWESIQAELGKCEVRCANCHRIKTATRGNWLKVRLMNGSGSSTG